jgi:Fe-S-cluster containining protein
MLLSKTDIKRIERLGYSCDFFVDTHDGWFQLKNRDEHCVFHNGMKCLIYEHRPEGCKLYPIIYDKDKKHVVFDKDCPQRDKFHMSKSITKQLYDLVSKLESERAERKKLKMK